MGMDKTIASFGEAVAGVEDGATVMIGGFGGSGSPIELIHSLIDRFRQRLPALTGAELVVNGPVADLVVSALWGERNARGIHL
jgi:acyl CoA:acetate/3-ketoacid CoA transferase alpha subunit